MLGAFVNTCYQQQQQLQAAHKGNYQKHNLLSEIQRVCLFSMLKRESDLGIGTGQRGRSKDS